MAKPAPEEFDIVDDVTVVHRPTGCEFAASRASSPPFVRIEYQKFGMEGDYDYDEVMDVALSLLRELASRKGSGG